MVCVLCFGGEDVDEFVDCDFVLFDVGLGVVVWVVYVDFVNCFSCCFGILFEFGERSEWSWYDDVFEVICNSG